MFSFAWSEIILIAVVALVLIGPKDLPVAIRAISGVIKKLRRMAGEFQGHVDEMMREADLSEMRDVINDVRGLDLKRSMSKVLDPDTIFAPGQPPGFGAPLPAHRTGLDFETRSARTLAENPIAMGPIVPAPAFIPPGSAPPAPIQQLAEPPAFLPPGIIAGPPGEE